MKLQELHSYIQEHQPNICQISVLQSGNELYSAEWNGYQRTDCVHIASATKSVMALLIGITIDRQRIGSVDDKVLAYFPEYSVKRGEKTIFDVTIRQLLTMRAPYKGHGDPWTKVCTDKNWTEASLNFLGGKGGVTDEFDYRTVCLHILSGILFKAVGMKPVDFANESLFCPPRYREARKRFCRNGAGAQELHHGQSAEKECVACRSAGTCHSLATDCA